MPRVPIGMKTYMISALCVAVILGAMVAGATLGHLPWHTSTEAMVLAGLSGLAMAAIVVLGLLWLCRRIDCPAHTLSKSLEAIARGEKNLHIPKGKLKELDIISDAVDAFQANSLARIEAETQGAVRREFLSLMSHELRTPLNGMTSMGEALQATDLDEDQAKMVAILTASSHTLRHVVKDMFLLSELENDTYEPQWQSANLREILMPIFMMAQTMAKAKRIQLKTEIDLPETVECDPLSVRQTLHHLLNNAIKFTPENSEIICHIKAAPAPQSMTYDHHLVITVKDTGPGIPEEILPQVFDLKLPTKDLEHRRHDGLGLGLYLVKMFADRTEGTVEVDTTPGQGTTITTRIGLKSVKRANPSTDDDAFELAPPERILVVEDNAQNRQVLGIILSQVLGVEPTYAEDGRQAVEACEHQSFDLILMDINMPVMDGMEATRRIRAREAQQGHARTPIVAVTANAMSHHIAEQLNCGMDAHVPIPIEACLLMSGITRAMGLCRKRAIDSALNTPKTQNHA